MREGGRKIGRGRGAGGDYKREGGRVGWGKARVTLRMDILCCFMPTGTGSTWTFACFSFFLLCSDAAVSPSPPAPFSALKKNWGCPADLLTNQTVLDPKSLPHLEGAAGRDTSPPTKVVALPTKPQTPYRAAAAVQPDPSRESALRLPLWP